MERLIINLLAFFGNKRAVQRRTCRLVRMCFDDVDWTVGSFSSGNTIMEDKNGNKHFYATKDIDRAIKKLNGVLNKLG